MYLLFHRDDANVDKSEVKLVNTRIDWQDADVVK